MGIGLNKKLLLMNFERGKSVKESMGIGYDAMLKELGAMIVHREDFQKKLATPQPALWELRAEPYDRSVEAGLVIAIYDGKFRILKNRYGDGYVEGLEGDLPRIVREIYEKVKDWATWEFDIETMPMSNPSNPNAVLIYKNGKLQFSKGKKS